jgi:hypothetical protein
MMNKEPKFCTDCNHFKQDGRNPAWCAAVPKILDVVTGALVRNSTKDGAYQQRRSLFTDDCGPSARHWSPSRLQYNDAGDMVRTDGTILPSKHVKIVRKNLEKGEDWMVASPMYPISRAEAAFIMAHTFTTKVRGKKVTPPK